MPSRFRRCTCRLSTFCTLPSESSERHHGTARHGDQVQAEVLQDRRPAPRRWPSCLSTAARVVRLGVPPRVCHWLTLTRTLGRRPPGFLDDDVAVCRGQRAQVDPESGRGVDDPAIHAVVNRGPVGRSRRRRPEPWTRNATPGPPLSPPGRWPAKGRLLPWGPTDGPDERTMRVVAVDQAGGATCRNQYAQEAAQRALEAEGVDTAECWQRSRSAFRAAWFSGTPARFSILTTPTVARAGGRVLEAADVRIGAVEGDGQPGCRRSRWCC